MKIVSPNSINKPNTYNVGGKEWEVERYTKVKIAETNEQFYVPIVNIPMMSDYQWQLNCLNDRLEHPEKYEADEDVPKTIAKIKQWLSEHEPQ